MHVLGGDTDRCVAGGLESCGKSREGRGDDDVAMLRGGNQGPKGLKEGACLRLRFVHLPIAGDDRAAQSNLPELACLFVSASTPGSLSPARNSSEAPPPVEMWEICLATPACSAAATESPPPTIEVAPAFVASATARAIPSVPWENGGFSNMPSGPFQTIVRAEEISRLKSSI